MQNNMKHISTHLAIRLLSVFIMTILSLKATIWVAEHYFFDKFFYRKSAMHGYSKDEGNPLAEKDLKGLLKPRLQDLNELLQTNDYRILGEQSDNNTYKVALIGDSFVYGTGVRTSERFGEVLEKKLNLIRLSRVYVLAQPGDDLIDNFAKFELAFQYIQPDIYILGMVDNDISFGAYDKYPQGEKVYFALKRKCPQEVYRPPNLGTQISEEDLLLKLYWPAVSPHYSNICMLFEGVKSILTKTDAVIFYNFSQYEYSNIEEKEIPETDKIAQKLMAKYEQTVKMAGARVIGFNYDKRTVQQAGVSQLEGHPSRELHYQYAEDLFQEITSNSKWKFKD